MGRRGGGVVGETMGLLGMLRLGLGGRDMGWGAWRKMVVVRVVGFCGGLGGWFGVRMGLGLGVVFMLILACIDRMGSGLGFIFVGVVGISG